MPPAKEEGPESEEQCGLRELRCLYSILSRKPHVLEGGKGAHGRRQSGFRCILANILNFSSSVFYFKVVCKNINMLDHDFIEMVMWRSNKI